MAVKAGSRYEETREMLAELIRFERISVPRVKSDNRACYFCGKPISDEALVLRIREIANERQIETEFYLDEECYNSVRFPRDFN